MLQVGDVVINADVEDIIEQIQDDTELLQNVIHLENDIMVSCPVHKGGMEVNPSLGIHKHTGQVHCFTCGYKGDIVALVSECYGISPTQAKQKLVGKLLYSGRRQLDIDILPRVERVDYIPNTFVQYYQSNNRVALQYLKYRGIKTGVAKHFPIGYNTDKGTIMLFTQDLKGNCVFYKERNVFKKRFYNSQGIKKSNYLYGAYQLLQSSWQPHYPVWVCESELDALTVWSRGGYAVAIGGSHISNKQLNILGQLGVRRLVNGLDRDDAGRQGWKSLCNLVRGISTYDTKFPTDKKDINELTEIEFKNIEII